jgi:hypothetical protein
MRHFFGQYQRRTISSNLHGGLRKQKGKDGAQTIRKVPAKNCNYTDDVKLVLPTFRLSKRYRVHSGAEKKQRYAVQAAVSIRVHADKMRSDHIPPAPYTLPATRTKGIGEEAKGLDAEMTQYLGWEIEYYKMVYL